MDEKQTVDSNLFEGLAYGVFESSADTDTGRASLLQAYNSYNWSDPDKANATLEYYGQALKNKANDQTSFGPEIENLAPVKLTDIPIEGLKDDQELYSKWEEANNEYLKTTKEPQYLVARKQLLDDVKGHASEQRRAANNAQMESAVGDGVFAKALDFNTRAIQGAVTGIEPYINSAVNIFTDGFELNNYLTEITDKDQDNSLTAAIASGYGSTLGALTAGIAGPAGVLAYGTTQAVDATVTRYQDTLSKTGDPSAARTAGVVEAGSQAIQLVGEQLVFGKIANKTLGGGKEVLKAGLTEAAAEGSGQAISNVAENIETGRPAGENVGRNVPTSTVLGGVFAGGATSISNRFPSKRNTTARKDELSQDGTVVTPVTTQKVGDLIQETDNEDVIPADEDTVTLYRGEKGQKDTVGNAKFYSPSKDVAQMYAGESGSIVERQLKFTNLLSTPTWVDAKKELGLKTSASMEDLIVEARKQGYDGLKFKTTNGEEYIDVTPKESKEPAVVDTTIDVPAPSSPYFETEDGKVYMRGPSGQAVKQGTLPLDQTGFVQDDQRAKIVEALKSGEQLTTQVDEATGEHIPVIERVTDEGKTVLEPIQFSKEATKGSSPLNFSAEKAPSQQQRIRPVQLGQRIRTVFPDKSIGAASINSGIVQKESAYSQKLRASETVAPGLRAIGQKGIFYDVNDQPSVDAETNSFMSKAGVEGGEKLLEDPSSNEILKAGVGTYLHNLFDSKLQEAQITALHDGDVEPLLQAAVDAERVLNKVSADLTAKAQGLALSKGKSNLNPLRIAKATNQAFQKELINQATEEKVDPLDIAKSPKAVEELNQAIKRVKDKTLEGKEPTESDKKKIEKLETEKIYQEKLVNRRRKAEKKALEAAQQQTEDEKQLAELNELLLDKDLPKKFSDKVKAQIAVIEGSNETDPVRRDRFYKLWVASQIGSVLGITVGTISSGLIAPIAKSAGLLGPTGKAFINNLASGSLNKYQYPLFKYWGGLVNSTALSRGGKLAWDALFHGERLENIIPPDELKARSNSKFSGIRYQDTIKDYTNFTKALKWHEGADPRNILVAAEKIAGRTSGLFLRTLAATEAVIYSMHDSGFDRAAAGYYYNQALNDGANIDDAKLQQYKYDGKANWERAQVEAKFKADKLRKANIEVTPAQEYIGAVEVYQGMRPREVQISAFKNAAQVVLNSPAPGLTGLFSDHLQKFTQDLEGTVLSPTKYLVPFANSIANQIGMALDLTPFALGGLSEKANRTAFERSMMVSSAATGTTIAMGLGLLAIKNLDLPEDERLFDIIGMYSADKKKRDAFVQGGGVLYSLKIGKTYIPFSETPFVLLLGGMATSVDLVRNGEQPHPENAASYASAAFMMAGGSLGGLGQISMLRGVSDLAEAVGGFIKGEDGAEVKVARSVASTMKGFVPGASLLRNLSRYTEQPLDAKKDIASAIVEGVPGLNSVFGLGRPALNIFGEPMKAGKDNETLQLHRIFSTKGSDLDIRWLVDNGYTVPAIGNMQFSKEIQAYVAADKGANALKLDYDLKYKVFSAAAPDLRNLMGQYRRQFQHSAFNPAVQESLNTNFNKILAAYKAKVVTSK